MRTSSPGDRVSFYKPGYQRDSADLETGIPSREILPTLAACLMKKCKYLKHFFFDVNLNLLRNFNLSDCVWETTCCHVKHESSHYQQPAGCSYLVKSKSQIQNLLSHFTVFPLYSVSRVATLLKPSLRVLSASTSSSVCWLCWSHFRLSICTIPCRAQHTRDRAPDALNRSLPPYTLTQMTNQGLRKMIYN